MTTPETAMMLTRLRAQNITRRFSLSNFRRFSSGDEEPEGAEAKMEKKAFGFPVPKLPPGYNPHKPPPCAAWDLSCHTWTAIDRDNTAVTNWHHPDEPDNFSRILIDDEEDGFTDFERLDFARMHDSVKNQMYEQYSSDPETWTVAKLATDYGIEQPRVQAILLLKEWEKQERALGLVTEDDDELEEMVHQAHLRTVRKIEEEYNIKLDTEKYERRAEKIRNAPLAKFRFLGDMEPAPEKPDPDFHIKRSEAQHLKKLRENEEQESRHRRVKNKRYTFVIKDTTHAGVI